MSILFYRRPDYLSRPAGPINHKDCQRYVERAKTLPEREKALSPPFYPETADAPDLSRGRDMEKDTVKKHKDNDREKSGYKSNGAALFSEDKNTPSPTRPAGEAFEHSFETPSASEFSSIPNDADVAAQAGLKWQPSTVAAYKGLCVIMYFSHSRALRPWEQNLDEELTDVEVDRRGSSASDQRGAQVSSSDGPQSQTPPDYVDSNATTQEDSQQGYSRPTSMRSFGPKNSYYENANWKSRYERKSLFRKIFDRETYTQDPALKFLQDRIIIGAVIWAVIITIPLTVVFVALPKGNYYG
ncbi:hypothetical protein M7I_0339 [Glarea lozoyensis 74030]|uniref:Uncharacterized protein n=1 Tax=Glarea lozoyensis (strain ATCC 74030 / MF5533) TaxID=1104152 RepID=H0ED39_GLAL7|nr:hypothetical protein M7I_0339 [Glarea lozoyensis 74030]